MLSSELEMPKGTAAMREFTLRDKHTAAAGTGASGDNTGTDRSSNSNGSDDQIVSTLNGSRDSSSNGKEPDTGQDGTGSNSSTSSDSSAGGLAAGSHQVVDPGYLQRLKEAASTPINVVIMTMLLPEYYPSKTANILDYFPSNPANCSVDGIALDCHVTQNQVSSGCTGWPNVVSIIL